MSLLRHPKTKQDGQDVWDGQDGRGLKVDIDNVDIGLRRGELHEVLTYPNALRQDKKVFFYIFCARLQPAPTTLEASRQ